MKTIGNLAVARPKYMISSTDFIELYEKHQAAVFRVALRITGNSADAEDVLQTVFLKVYAQGDRPRDERTADAYFRRAATNAAIDILRRRSTHAEVQIDEVQTHAVREPEMLLKEQLRRAIAELSPEDAELFLLRFVEGFSNGELADLLGQEKSNIAVRLHRIRQTLQKEMNR